MGPVLCVPLVALLPFHAPEAVHVVALVDDHVRDDVEAAATVDGFALIDTVGGFTVTVADDWAVPPDPEQLSV